MKVAILSEGPTDEAAVAMLAGAVLVPSVEVIPVPIRHSPGVDALFRILPSAYLSVYYHSDADGLIVVADSNATPVHPADIGQECDEPECRLCMTRRAIRQAAAQVKADTGRGPLRWAVGLAVPAIEAWCLCAGDNNISENTWVQGLNQGTKPYTRRELKRRLYGPKPWPEQHTRKCIEGVTPCVADDLRLLENKFPIGFGALRADLRSWLH